VFDDFFETVFSEGDQEPDMWHDLVVFQSFTNEFDDEDYQPEVCDEWLNPIELQQCQNHREEERNRVLNSITMNGRNQNKSNSDNCHMAAHDNNRIERVEVSYTSECPSNDTDRSTRSQQNSTHRQCWIPNTFAQ
jgi:hypothetical protein